MNYAAIVLMLNGAFGVSAPMSYGECVAFIYQLQTQQSTKNDVKSAKCMSVHQEGEMTFFLPAIQGQ